MSAMLEAWKKDLIARVTSDPAFRSRDRLRHKQILEYLAEHSSPGDRHLRSERNIEEKFLVGAATPPNFIKRLAIALETYFAGEEGRLHTYIMEIPRGEDVDPGVRYAVLFRLNPRAVVRHFWQPHLDNRFRTFIAYGVPLFVRSADLTKFTRHANENIPADVKDFESPDDEICWPFVAHGDLLAAMELSRWLVNQGAGVDFGPFKANDGWKALKQATSGDANVIVLGSTRVNGILAEYQALKLEESPDTLEHLPFRLRLYDVVRVRNYNESEEEMHAEERNGSTMSVPVIITRRTGAIRNSVTLIGSNHGRAVHRAAEILTSEDESNTLFQDERLQRWRTALPPQFQILLRVTVLAGEDLGGSFSVVDVWPSD